MENYLKTIRAKDVELHLAVSEATAKRIYRDIKKEYGLERVTMGHLISYCGYDLLEGSYCLRKSINKGQ